MKLRTLDCKNCAAPLRQEGDRLVCAYCGSSFDIPADANDIEYEKIINAEDYIRLSLAKSLVNLENSYMTKEQINEEKRANIRRGRRERLKKNLIKAVIMMVLITIAEGALIFLVLFKNDDDSSKDVTKEVSVWDPGFRITPDDLRSDKEFMDYISNGIIAQDKEGHDGAVIFSSEDIWNVVKDPEIIGRYLVTEEDGNTLYILFKVTYETDDGRTLEMYDLLASRKLTVGTDGKIVYEGFEGCTTDEYDFRFHSNPELQPLYDDYICSGNTDPNIFLFEF